MKNKKYIITAAVAVGLVGLIFTVACASHHGGKETDPTVATLMQTLDDTESRTVPASTATQSEEESQESITSVTESDSAEDVSTESRTETPTTTVTETTRAEHSHTEEQTVEETTTGEVKSEISKDDLESTDFSFTTIKVEQSSFDYFTYLKNKGYTYIDSDDKLKKFCTDEVLSLKNGKKNVLYIMTEPGRYNALVEGLDAARKLASSTNNPKDIMARDSYLYQKLGFDYQKYYADGMAIFMIRKIQDICNEVNDFSVYAVYYYSYENGQQRDLVDSIISDAVKNFTGTDYEKALAAHDYLCERTEYATGADAHILHTAYGALVDRSAVCEGYAKAYKKLLSAMGIECEVVINSEHAWNVVQIEGLWYFVDVTNDDTNKFHALFMLGRDVLMNAVDMNIDSYFFGADSISYYGYSDGNNTDTKVLAHKSLMRKIEYADYNTEE